MGVQACLWLSHAIIFVSLIVCVQVSATDTERVARPASTRAAAAAAIAAAAREEKLPRRTADPAAQGPVVAERSKMAAVTEAAAAAAAAAAMGTAAVGTDGRPVSAQTALHGAGKPDTCFALLSDAQTI